MDRRSTTLENLDQYMNSKSRQTLKLKDSNIDSGYKIDTNIESISRNSVKTEKTLIYDRVNVSDLFYTINLKYSNYLKDHQIITMNGHRRKRDILKKLSMYNLMKIVKQPFNSFK